MAKKIPPRNARAAHRREVIATRRIGEGKKCSKCGETRTRALIPSSDPVICAACDRKARKKSEKDNHHIAGPANSPITIKIPVNDHRADLSVSQQDWPRKTLANPDRSPLLSGAAHIRGFADIIVYLVEKFLLWVADMLELLDTVLEQKLGQKWWERTKLKPFEPET
jgi:hypothetical protein